MPEHPPHQEGRGEAQSQSGSITYLEPALWQQLTDASTDQDFYLGWLRLQCRMIDAVNLGVVMMGPVDAGPFLPVAAWPEALASSQSFENLVQRVLRERKGVVVRYQADLPDEIPDRFHLGYPIKADNHLHGVIALDIAHRKPEELQSVMRQLQWGLAWLENWLLRKQIGPVEETQEQLGITLDIAARALQEESAQGAAMACVTELATRLLCDRVSLGFRKKEFVEVAALSHSAQFGKQMNLLRAIGRVMDECLDQGRLILYPSDDAHRGAVTRAHAELSSLHNSTAILTVPLFSSVGAECGALTLERGSGTSFTPGDVALCQAIGALLGPIVEEKRRNDRGLIERLRDGGRALLLKLFGSGHAGTKACSLALSVVVLFFLFAKGDYRITAKTVLEGEVQRAVTVPFDGYVEEALVRAGDIVKKGQLLAHLNDKDLVLERLKWASLMEQHQLEYVKALASREHAEAKVYHEQANQAAAELHLVEYQLARAKINAPFDGLVVSGDLSQSLGAPVARGDLLFEVAPLDNYRVMLDVDERDIGQIRVGQSGLLVLNSLPDQDLVFHVEKITPVSVPREGVNYFRVEARLQEPSTRLRPGMEGYGKVEVDRRHLVWIWTHELIDWLRLWAWKWMP
jgi:RND family efflux transporter MFP subunit